MCLFLLDSLKLLSLENNQLWGGNRNSYHPVIFVYNYTPGCALFFIVPHIVSMKAYSWRFFCTEEQSLMKVGHYSMFYTHVHAVAHGQGTGQLCGPGKVTNLFLLAYDLIW